MFPTFLFGGKLHMKLIKGFYCVLCTIGILSLASNNLKNGAVCLIGGCIIFLLYQYFAYCDRQEQYLEVIRATQMLEDEQAQLIIFGELRPASFDLETFYQKYKNHILIIVCTNCVHVLRR